MLRNDNDNSREKLLKQVKKNVLRQALLAFFIISLTVVLLIAMTTAWYTNIAHTSGLVFEAASWGFEGEILTTEEPIEAAPGDNGNVFLTLINDGDYVIDATVNISKNKMTKDMQQRLFFYVETTGSRNEEIMERVYVNSREGYTYTIFGMGNLTLTDAVHNDAQLKWQWVYDVLGYYVQGTLEEDGTVTIEEYLRPIEYDYDEALTTFAPRSEDEPVLELETIDGTVTTKEFLEQISQSDGYPGTIDIETKTPEGFYKVDVDEEGHGVWAYLCNYTEIVTATYVDTWLGSQAEKAKEDETIQLDSSIASLIISGQKSDWETVVINTQKSLEDALRSSENMVLQLAQDLSINSVIIPTGKKVVLDLNGHTLSTPSALLMDVEEGCSVTIFDGEISGDNIIGFTARGAELSFSNVTAEGISRLVALQDNYGLGSDSKVRLLDCNIKAEDSVVYLVGNGLASEQPTQLVIERCNLEGGYAGIAANGNTAGDGNWGTDTTIINSTIKGYWTSIYMPQKDSTLTITGSTLEGYTGIVLKGGHTKITSCNIKGTGAYGEPAYKDSGWADTGDGVYLEANYTWETVVEMHGSNVVKSDSALAVRKFEAEAPNACIAIYGGTFNSDVSAYVGEGAVVSEDGKIVTIPES